MSALGNLFLKFKNSMSERGFWGSFKNSVNYLLSLIDRGRQLKQAELRSIKNGRLKLCVDEKRIRIFYDNEEITKAIGFNTAILSEGRWASSTDADFDIKKVSDSNLTIYSQWQKLPVSQAWNINLLQDEVVLDVKMELKQPVRIDRKNISIYLTKKISNWYTESQLGEFPPIFNENRPQLLYNNKDLNCLISSDRVGIDVSINRAADRDILIQNSDSLHCARLLQIEDMEDEVLYETGSIGYMHISLKFITDEQLLKMRQYYTDKIDILKRNEEEIKNKWIESRTIRSNEIMRIFVDEENRIRIYNATEELTKGFGFYASVRVNGIWHDVSGSDSAVVNKIDDNRMKIEIKSKICPVTVIWQINIENNTINWGLSFIADNKVALGGYRQEVYVLQQYNKWFNDENCGFLGYSSTHWQETFAENQIKNYKILAIGDEKNMLPSLVCYFDTKDRTNLFLRTTDTDLSCRVVGAEYVNEIGLFPGAEMSFNKLHIELIHEPAQFNKFIETTQNKWQKAHSIISPDKRLKLYFDDGIFNLYWDDIELTKGEGAITGFLHRKNWYVSEQASTSFDKKALNHVEIIKSWPNLPVKYIWNINLNNCELCWDIKLEVLKDIKISKKYMLFYMTNKYNLWMDNYSQGEFPSDFGFDWQQMSFNDASFIGLNSSRSELPAIICKAESEKGRMLLIQNTNRSLSSRILKIEQSDFEEYYDPGTYALGMVKINIVNDKNDLNKIIDDIKENDRKSTDKFLVKNIAAGDCQIFADNEELNEKISGSKNKDALRKIRDAVRNKKPVKIGLSRYNFMSLDKVINYCLRQNGRYLDLRVHKPVLFPVNKLKENYVHYLKRLAKLIEPYNLELFLHDNELFDILDEISGRSYFHNEKDLLRLLGVISEEAIIGPQTIVVDTYHRCNTNCLHCWIHTPQMKNSREFLDAHMETERYKQIIDDAAELYVDEIIFQGAGEPLLDKRLIEMITYAKQRGLKVIIFTNGTLLNAKMSRLLIDLQVDEIFCSFPAGTAKTYKIINPKLQEETFYKTVKNLKNLIALRNKKRCERPYLQMTHVMHAMNCHEIKDMAELSVYIGADKIRFYMIRLDSHIKFLQLKPNDIEVMKKGLEFAIPYLKSKNVELQDNVSFQMKNYSSETGNWSDKVFLEKGCPVGWFFCMILAHGDVSMCCHMRVVDYLNNKRFKDIWSSYEYKKFRTAAKFLNENKNVVFANDVKAYDAFCGKCDTHQVILRVEEMLKSYNLDTYCKLGMKNAA